MVSLVALLSSGKGTWAQVLSLIKLQEFDEIFFICNDFAYDNFKIEKDNVIKIKFDEKNPTSSLDKVSKELKSKVKDFEIALNLSSGTGIEHMMVVSAVLKAGLGLRFVSSENDKLVDFDILDEEYIHSNDEI